MGFRGAIGGSSVSVGSYNTGLARAFQRPGEQFFTTETRRHGDNLEPERP
jgi:hypothetical protein